MPYSQSWNFGVQRELADRIRIEVNYVGSKGTRLLRLVDGNPPQPAFTFAVAGKKDQGLPALYQQRLARL